ncbi:MAG TPA: BlaI/MecI/CopY family transcriptional regulator [Abditibacteriaceae bacterium]|jgi:predicted transcriptional regulator
MGNLGTKELEVLRYVADHAPITVGEVAEGFGEPRGLARTTMLSVMEKLREKGHVTRKKIGGVYRYSTCVSKAQLMQNLIRDFMDRALGGSLSPFVAYVAEEAKVSDEEYQELQRLMQELEAQRAEAKVKGRAKGNRNAHSEPLD